MGLGLDQFLNHNEDGGGRRKFLNWKDKGKATVWLSTRASVAYPTWGHPFYSIGTWTDKKTDEEKEALNFNRFVSPDAEIVHQSQFFRDDNTDRMRVPPLLDPFLLLREWLRFECDAPNDAVVFKWTDPKTSEITEWRKGRLARLVEKGGGDWNQTLDTKLEYMFVVVDNESPADGVQIVRGTKLLGDQMKLAIKQEMESNGEKGNPLKNPYAFRWVYDKNAKSPMQSYRAFRYNGADLTDEIRELIMSPDFPDPTPDCRPRDGDKAKIRAAMEDAAQMDLPWDLIFSPRWVDGGGEATSSSSKSAPSGRAQETSSGSGEPRTRRKKAEPPPEVPRIPCDDCGHPMLPTEAKCVKCGAVYEVDGEPEPAPAAATGQKLAATPTPAAPKTATPPSERCWSCQGPVVNNRCTECGLDVTDEVPY